MKTRDCEEIRLALIERIEHAQPVAGDPNVDRHMRSCAACRTFAKEVAVLVADLAELRELSRLKVLPDENRAGFRRVAHRLRWAIGMAAVLAMSFGLWQVNRSVDEVIVDAGPDVIATPMERPGTVVRLRGESKEKYFLVEKESKRSGVRVIWLHRQFTGVADKDDEAGPGHGGVDVLKKTRVS